MWRFLVLAIAACADLPYQLPIPPEPQALCGNAVLDANEQCDGFTYARDTYTRLPCGAPDTTLACHLVCTEDVCPSGMVCDAEQRCVELRYLQPLFPEPLAHVGSDFYIGSFFTPGFDDVVAWLGSTVIVHHLRESSLRKEIQLAVPRTGPAIVAPLDDDGLVDVAYVAAGSIEVLRSTGTSLAPAATLPLAAGETVLALAAGQFGTPLEPDRDLLALVETASGRVLRRYAGRALAAYTAADVTVLSDASLELAQVPVVWSVAAGGPFGDELYVVVDDPRAVVEIQFGPAGLRVLDVPLLSQPVVAVEGAPIGRDGPATTFAYSSPTAVFSPDGMTDGAATSTLAWLSGPHTQAGIVFAQDDVIRTIPPLAPQTISFAPRVVRTADANGDGIQDVIASDGTQFVVLLAGVGP
ncbi:MAG TPA: trypsin inhibitor-like cysteine-rich domain-containing protein [Kofleriaceae bacterium]|nr:trypsin inhibitor-like cysteine-rich domain-containing protein [Kofleriaceae bacterium]